MKDNKDMIIQLQEEVIKKCENIITLQKDKEKIMQDMIDTLTKQLKSVKHFLNRK
jgi:predicted translin family RNA/ssDNA-binding protein